MGREVFETGFPTLFIFDAEQSSGEEQPAVYELPLKTISRGHRTINTFQLPDDSAFVGNSADILPEFVIGRGKHHHFMMSATHNNSIYYLANIEIDSRNPLDDKGAGFARGQPYTTPTTQNHTPFGIMDLRGAGIFVADNIKVVMDPADSDMRIGPVDLGCSNYADGFGTEENFVYRFMHTEFDLSQGEQGPTRGQNAALSVRCLQKKGQVQLTLKNTKTVISVPTGRTTTVSPKSSSVLFYISLWPRENVLSFVDSTCNSVVDQLGNDLSIDPDNPSDPEHYMGRVFSNNYCSGIKMINGAFGLKDREQAWGWVPAAEHIGKHRCWAADKKAYHAGFASVSEWSSAGYDVACNCSMPTSTSSILNTSVSPFTTSYYTTRVSPALIPDVGDTAALVMNKTDAEGLKAFEKLTMWQKVGVGAGVFLADQLVTQPWFHLSKRIRQAWIRHTSQALAITFGLGFPALQWVPKCISGLRGRSGHVLLGDKEPLGNQEIFEPR
ncbi:hypothetical protein [Endozoicomonas sp. 8E]|uniref:hypothetical protein n=1 Tax=Endozoicomonas sp. 8E TaxID=3035692 RepID=UPI0029394F4C|nr:hypothetical protein [Endozoicomonas sp. 8E]WOG29698.1 hypothetical protein P6910_08600 [Endozoicomonas sp. 8E]